MQCVSKTAQLRIQKSALVQLTHKNRRTQAMLTCVRPCRLASAVASAERIQRAVEVCVVKDTTRSLLRELPCTDYVVVDVRRRGLGAGLNVVSLASTLTERESNRACGITARARSHGGGNIGCTASVRANAVGAAGPIVTNRTRLGRRRFSEGFGVSSGEMTPSVKIYDAYFGNGLVVSVSADGHASAPLFVKSVCSVEADIAEGRVAR